MEKDYAGLTTCKVTALGDFVTSESFSATSCSGMLKKWIVLLTFPRPLLSAAVGGQMLGQVNSQADKAGLFLRCCDAISGTYETSGTAQG